MIAIFRVQYHLEPSLMLIDPPPCISPFLFSKEFIKLSLKKLSSFTSGEASTFGGLGRAVAAMPARPIADPPVMGRPGSAAPDMAPNGQNVGYGSQLPVDAMSRPGRDTVPLPPDASNTLYVEGLPPDSTRREVAHIFRPFVGYKEVRLVSKESRHRGGDPIILCFADFSSPACAATAMSLARLNFFPEGMLSVETCN